MQLQLVRHNLHRAGVQGWSHGGASAALHLPGLAEVHPGTRCTRLKRFSDKASLSLSKVCAASRKEGRSWYSCIACMSLNLKSMVCCLQAYQDRLAQLFAGGPEMQDIRARSELASLVSVKVSSLLPAAC